MTGLREGDSLNPVFVGINYHLITPLIERIRMDIEVYLIHPRNNLPVARFPGPS
jgi:hypothetical protein